MSQYTIGFSNLDEENPFTVTVRRNLQAAVAKHPNIRLIVRNNALHTPTAKQHAQEFADVPVDLAIIFHIDERAGMEITNPLRRRGIPIVSIDIPIMLTTFFGINTQQAGTVAGDALAEWVQRHWDGKLDIILVMTEYRVLDVFQQRFDYAVKAIQDRLGADQGQVMEVDNGGERSVTAERVGTLLNTGWKGQNRIAVVCMNDKIAAGVLDAVRQLGCEERVAVLSFDGTAVALEEFRKPHSRLIVSPSFRADLYGTGLLTLAERILSGERVPTQNYVQPFGLTRWNFEDHLELFSIAPDDERESDILSNAEASQT